MARWAASGLETWFCYSSLLLSLSSFYYSSQRHLHFLQAMVAPPPRCTPAPRGIVVQRNSAIKRRRTDPKEIVQKLSLLSSVYSFIVTPTCVFPFVFEPSNAVFYSLGRASFRPCPNLLLEPAPGACVFDFPFRLATLPGAISGDGA